MSRHGQQPHQPDKGEKMKSKLLIFLLTFSLSGEANAYNEDLSKVSFEFDDVPCGIGSLWGSKGNMAIPVTFDGKVYDLPVIQHFYAKNGKTPYESNYNPLEWYSMLSYIREKVNGDNTFKLVAYAKNYFLGDTPKDVNSSYNKIYSGLKQKLGNENQRSETQGKPDLYKSSMWLAQKNDKITSVELRVINIGAKKFAAVESVCYKEYTEATALK